MILTESTWCFFFPPLWMSWKDIHLAAHLHQLRYLWHPDTAQKCFLSLPLIKWDPMSLTFLCVRFITHETKLHLQHFSSDYMAFSQISIHALPAGNLSVDWCWLKRYWPSGTFSFQWNRQIVPRTDSVSSTDFCWCANLEIAPSLFPRLDSLLRFYWFHLAFFQNAMLHR